MLHLVRLEMRMLRRDSVAMVVLAVLLLAALVAVANGRTLVSRQQAGRDAAQTQAARADADTRAKLAAAIDPVDAAYLTYRLGMTVVAALPPLIDASAGQAGIANYTTSVAVRDRPDTLFKRTQIGNPELLARGGLDLGFVAIVIAPLLLIGLGHGIFVTDRDNGTARLVLAQAGSAWRLLLARSITRLAVVILPLVLALGVLLVAGPSVAGRGAAALQWVIITLLYLSLWWAIILYINSWRITAETAALALVSAWAIVTLVLPAAISVIAQLAYPPPSRFEQIAAAREAEIAATTAWNNDHKRFHDGDVAGAFADLRRTIGVNRIVDAAVTPINRRFDERLTRQQAVTGWLALLSPPAMAGDALVVAAGTGGDAGIAFRHSTYAYLQDLKRPLERLINEGKPMTAAAYDALPRYTPPPTRPSPVPAMVYLALGILLFGALAAHRFAAIRLD